LSFGVETVSGPDVRVEEGVVIGVDLCLNIFLKGHDKNPQNPPNVFLQIVLSLLTDFICSFSA
jgi:hypothetical protein